jgi:hypothetical protein
VTDGPTPGSPADLARQLREAADRLMTGWTSVGSRPGGPGESSIPRLPVFPATVSAEQVQRLLDDLSARRAQVQALRDQLTSFDEQLGVLEAGLRPVVEWTRSWAALEKSVADFWRLPGSRSSG